ncbi:hypothetical protein SAY86_017755 [Trapa natans]|uniref:Uncharacterized protein n=1 Tax=Trapa natans TaxID=22666 RepID=A0AAN7LQ31_TRANT|nr:hypothetical protein SAY86_017755 [Trapa natans]
MSKAWGKMGAWAAEAERAEEEEREAAAAAAAASAASQNFPSLKEAARAKPKKKKMSLTDFYAGNHGLTPDEMLRLPTGPKERSAEEMQQGGFSSYGRSGLTPNRTRDREDGDGAWGGGRRAYGGGFDDERRSGPPSRVSDFDQPSRADEADNWAMGKKSFPAQDSLRQNRYDSLGSGASRADETDNWAMGKRQQQAPPPSRSSTFGSGFLTSQPEPDRWSRGAPQDERPRLVLDPPKLDTVVNEPVKANRPSPFGAARPREEVLAGKGLDWKKLESDIEAKKADRPTSSQSSRPSSAHSSGSEIHGTDNALKPKPKVNPFGDAKPRELLLEEKGLDWRKIDLQLEHRRVDREETDKEKALKEELDLLKRQEQELEMNKNDKKFQELNADHCNLSDIISQKEKELEMLSRDLDDKVRFKPKASERPDSGLGRASGFSDRPRSWSGSIDESQSLDYDGRPPSRGTGNARARPGSDRREFQGGREGGFFSSRDFDRSSTRERW